MQYQHGARFNRRCAAVPVTLQSYTDSTQMFQKRCPEQQQHHLLYSMGSITNESDGVSERSLSAEDHHARTFLTRFGEAPMIPKPNSWRVAPVLGIVGNSLHNNYHFETFPAAYALNQNIPSVVESQVHPSVMHSLFPLPCFLRCSVFCGV